MKKLNPKILIPLLLFVLLFAKTAHLQSKVNELESPIRPLGTYQIHPQEKEKAPMEVLVVTQENDVYVYNQFEALVKSPLTKHQEDIYSFQWDGTKFLKFERDYVTYLDNEKKLVYSIRKVGSTPAFINIKKEDFEEKTTSAKEK